jgi:uncharacterized damage-inducible protein DinB
MTRTADIATTLFGDLDAELANTRRILERVPTDQLGYRPHEKSYSLGELATHIANLPNWMTGIVGQAEFDLAGSPPDLAVPDTPDEIVADFDSAVAGMRQTLAAAADEAWSAPWTLRMGDHVIFTLPRAAVFRNAGISHLIHHRAQLGVYLRLLDVAVPGMYGPSADEQ